MVLQTRAFFFSFRNSTHPVAITAFCDIDTWGSCAECARQIRFRMFCEGQNIGICPNVLECAYMYVVLADSSHWFRYEDLKN